MYAAYFGLKQAPFSIAPDPHYLFMSERHREALAHLLYGVGGGGGFVLLTGEIGAGKTTVCRCFLEQIPRRCNVAYIFNPKLNVAELLQVVCDEFRIPVPQEAQGPASMKAHVDALNEYLLKTHAVGQNNVLIIDEAQSLSAEVLEQLRLLTNLETSERKLLQIVLIGQPELRQMLAQPALEQLAQRIIARFHLEALSESETAQYIAHRLNMAGLRRGTLFEDKAVRRIHQITRGVPRRINLLCDRALLGAYAENKSRVDAQVVDKAAAEVFEGHHIQAPAWAKESPASGASRRADADLGGLWQRLIGQGGSHASMASKQLWLGGLAVTLSGLALATWMHRHSALTPLKNPPLAAKAASLASGAHGAPTTSEALTGKPALHGNAAAASSTAASVAQVDPQTLMQQASRSEDDAWRDLATMWQTNLGQGDPCTQARREGLMCFRGSGGLGLLAQLDRPALLTLQDAEGHTRHAVLTRMDAHQAWLKVGDNTTPMPLNALSSIWRGDFATLWRAPEGFRSKLTLGQSGPAVSWLATRIAQIDKGPALAEPARLDAALQARLQAFQLAHGLKPDGVAGATTFMLINRASGVPEPRLAVAQATAQTQP